LRHPYCTHQRPLAFGHRGAAGIAPENTLVSFKKALDAGVDGLELDIHPSKDGVPIVIHDDTLERTTNGRGLVRETPLAALRELDAGHGFTTDGTSFPFRGKGEKVPTLEEVFEMSGEKRLNVDFKETSPAMEHEVDRLIERFGARDRVLVCSSDDRLAPVVRKRFAGMATSACTREVAALVLLGFIGLGRFVVPRVNALQIPRSHLGIPVLTERVVALAHRRDMDVHVWTVNDEAGMKHCLELGVDGIMSDFPEKLVDVMKRAGVR
jgi:glycerophosphoryl diester phosphodiesterase